MFKSVVVGCGSYLPPKILTNYDLEKIVSTTHDWIVERTGIHSRHIAGDDDTTASMGIKAGKKALEMAKSNGISVDDIDLVILATSTPDNVFPASAATIQHELGITKGCAFDINAVCSGFVFALTTADNYIKTGQAKTALVIGSDTISRIVDWEDRSTCVLFGDGAGAVVLQSSDENEERGIIHTHIRTDGKYSKKLCVDGGISSSKSSGYIRMEGREVFRHAIVNIAQTIEETLKSTGMTADDIDWFVPHQANKRILDGTAKKAGLAPEKVVITLDKHGNTSAASIPLALDLAVCDGRIKTGDLVLIEAMGGGFTWGSALIRW